MAPSNGLEDDRAILCFIRLSFVRLLYVAFVEVLVVLFTGVFHDFPVGPKREYSGVLPWPGERFRILDGNLVADVRRIGSGEALYRVHRVTVQIGRASCRERG